MRFRIHILSLFVVAFLLSGCYTQLQYSQRVNRITEERPSIPGYSWDGDENEVSEKAPAAQDNGDNDYVEGYEDGYRRAVDDIPIRYRDYPVANWYDRHYYYRDPFYDWYYPYGSSLSISFSFGSPYRSGYWAFMDPFDYYWFFHSPFRFYRPYYNYPGYYAYYFGPRYYSYPNYYFFRTGYADYVGPVKDSNRKYGRRTIGTDRVAAERNRYDRPATRTRNGASVQNAEKGRRTTVMRNRGNSDTERRRSVRSRTSSDTGSRIRSTGRSSRSSGRDNRNGNVERRSRDNDQRTLMNTNADRNRNAEIRIDPRELIRNRYRDAGNVRDRDRADVENRIRNYRAPDIDRNEVDRSRFEERINLIRRYRIFDSMSRSGRSLDKSRTKVPSRTKINSSNSNTRTRSRIKSRSRSGSSRGRSSSSGRSSGSSSKKRSRGGN